MMQRVATSQGVSHINGTEIGGAREKLNKVRIRLTSDMDWN